MVRDGGSNGGQKITRKADQQCGDNGCGGNSQEETAKREPLEAASAVAAYTVKHLIPKNGDGLDIS
jgi:hypothetical protein